MNNDIYNDTGLSFSHFPFEQKPFGSFGAFGASDKPQIEQIEKSSVLVIDSSSRDTDTHPLSTTFTLPVNLRDVVEMTIIGGVFPLTDSINLDSFLYLDMGELNQVSYHGSRQGNIFSIIPLTPHHNTQLMAIDTNVIADLSSVRFPSKIDKISKLSISLHHSDGTPCNFGSSNWTLFLKVVSKQVRLAP